MSSPKGREVAPESVEEPRLLQKENILAKIFEEKELRELYGQDVDSQEDV